MAIGDVVVTDHERYRRLVGRAVGHVQGGDLRAVDRAVIVDLIRALDLYGPSLPGGMQSAALALVRTLADGHRDSAGAAAARRRSQVAERDAAEEIAVEEAETVVRLRPGGGPVSPV